MTTPPPLGLYRDTDTQRLCIQLPVGGQATAFHLAMATVAFFNGSKIQSSSRWRQFFNRALARFAGQLTHVELAFKFTSDDMKHECWVSCCICTGESLQFEAKTARFTDEIRENLWTLLALTNLTTELTEQLLTECVADVERGLSFNTALYCNFFVPWASCRYKGELEQVTWCSEHVATRLKALGLPAFSNLEPQYLTPQQLFERLTYCGYNQPYDISYQRRMTMAEFIKP
jgi:hypothetical protein